MRVLELYSGIGGMHFALKESKLDAKVVEAADINNIANLVYKHNFPETKVNKKSILSLTSNHINKLKVDMILMSPPCQPYSRNGNQLDIADPRSDSLSHLTNILPECDIKFILLENVRGFETSQSRQILYDSLKEKFHMIEFLINSRQFGVPNSRERYYLLARRMPFPDFSFPQPVSVPAIFGVHGDEETFCIGHILEFDDDDPEYNNYLLGDEILQKRGGILDILVKEDNRSGCFTKSYGRYIEGTGSVYSSAVIGTVLFRLILAKTEECEFEKLQHLLPLRLRFFTPTEISRLMCFPDEFEFPEGLTNRQKYNLLGNSINVKVVSHLIRYLTNTTFTFED